jgi:hypothetical protein
MVRSPSASASPQSRTLRPASGVQSTWAIALPPPGRVRWVELSRQYRMAAPAAVRWSSVRPTSANRTGRFRAEPRTGNRFQWLFWAVAPNCTTPTPSWPQFQHQPRTFRMPSPISPGDDHNAAGQWSWEARPAARREGGAQPAYVGRANAGFNDIRLWPVAGPAKSAFAVARSHSRGLRFVQI